MSICLLFCALYRALREIPNPDEDLHVELANLKRRLFVRGTRNWRFVPTEQSKNNRRNAGEVENCYPYDADEATVATVFAQVNCAADAD